MRKDKNRSKPEQAVKKDKRLICELCRQEEDVALVGMSVKGRVKWVCHKCYKG